MTVKNTFVSTTDPVGLLEEIRSFCDATIGTDGSQVWVTYHENGVMLHAITDDELVDIEARLAGHIPA